MTPPCKVAPAPVPAAKAGATRVPQAGWKYYECATCPLRVWIPPGEPLTFWCKTELPPEPSPS